MELERKFGDLVVNMLYDPSLKRGLASLYLKSGETGEFDKCPPAHSCHTRSGVHLVPGECKEEEVGWPAALILQQREVTALEVTCVLQDVLGNGNISMSLHVGHQRVPVQSDPNRETHHHMPRG